MQCIKLKLKSKGNFIFYILNPSIESQTKFTLKKIIDWMRKYTNIHIWCIHWTNNWDIVDISSIPYLVTCNRLFCWVIIENHLLCLISLTIKSEIITAFLHFKMYLQKRQNLMPELDLFLVCLQTRKRGLYLSLTCGSAILGWLLWWNSGP